MSVQTRHQCDEYYDTFFDHNLTLTKEIITSIGLVANKVFLRYQGENIPCILYSTSMSRARIIAQLRASICEKIGLGNKTASLCFSFKKDKKADPFSLFINTKIVGFTPYESDKPGVNFVTLQYMNKPPDDFIYWIGEILSNKTDEGKRKEERINIDDEKTRVLNPQTDKISILLNGKSNPCLLKDISLSGAKVITKGTKDYYLNKKILLVLQISTIKGKGEVSGLVAHCEDIIVNQNIKFIALGIAFEKEGVPESYKNWLLEYIKKNGHESKTE